MQTGYQDRSKTASDEDLYTNLDQPTCVTNTTIEVEVLVNDRERQYLAMNRKRKLTGLVSRISLPIGTDTTPILALNLFACR